MQASRLSSSDWVRRKADGRPLRITGITDKPGTEPHVEAYDPVTRGYVEEPVTNLEGIPMTDALAAKMGFSGDPDNHTLTGSGWFHKWLEKSDTEIALRPRKGILQVKVFDDHWFTMLDTEYCTHVNAYQHFLRMAGYQEEAAIPPAVFEN